MSWYRRARQPGGTYFFTVVTFARRPLFADPEARALLRAAIADARKTRPFSIDAICLLPDHLHAVWSLPDGDSDYSTRWGQIKGRFSHDYLARTAPKNGGDSAHEGDAWGKPHPTSALRRARKGEVAVWQRRFWEHLVRDDEDYRRHVEYIHYNPVKHGLVDRPIDWPHSSFHRHVREERYEPTWGATEPDRVRGMNRE